MKRHIARWRRNLAGRLTPAGWVVFISAAFTALLGLDTESSVAYQTFALLTAFLLASWIGIWIFRGRFRIQRILPRYGSVGDPLRYRVEITNQGKSRESGLRFQEMFGKPESEFSEWINHLRPGQKSSSFRMTRERLRLPPATGGHFPLPTLEPNQPGEAELEITPLRRGFLDFAEARISRTDPLGLLRAFIHVPCDQRVLILPPRHPIPELNLPGRQEHQPGGVTQAASVGQTDEFISLRDYQRGDPIRHIHWRSWAKTGEPIVKEFEDEYFVRYGLVLDTFGGEEQKLIFEEAVAIAASFASNLQTQESLIDLMFVGHKSYCFTTGRGVAHTDQLLEILACASLTQPRDGSFDQLASTVIAQAGRLSACIIVLLDWDAPRQELVRKLRELRLPIRVLVVTESDDPQLEPGPMADRVDWFHPIPRDATQSVLRTLR